MNYLTAILYGAIQGFSEFLPISSSGHLAVLPFLMDFKDPGVLFDLGLHLGTAAAVVWYFRRRILELLGVAGPGLLQLERCDERRVFVRNFIVATAVSAICIFILKPISHFGRSPWLVMVNQAFFGLLLWRADVVQRQKSTAAAENFFSERHRWREAILIGAAQGLAIFPGVSRSGITLTAAFLLGINRRQSSEFSFLLSLPVIVGGVLLELPELRGSLASGQFDLSTLAIGIVVSFVVGLITIHFFLKLISTIKLMWFSFYRLLLATLLLYFLVS